VPVALVPVPGDYGKTVLLARW